MSDTRILIKASFTQPVPSNATLRIGSRSVLGRMSDTRGEFWQFHIEGLEPDRRYTLSLRSGGTALCQPWELATFPDLNARPERFRVLFFTCAGGHDSFGFLSSATRHGCYAAHFHVNRRRWVANAITATSGPMLYLVILNSHPL